MTWLVGVNETNVWTVFDINDAMYSCFFCFFRFKCTVRISLFHSKLGIFPTNVAIVALCIMLTLNMTPPSTNSQQRGWNSVYQGQTAQASYSFSEHDFLHKTFQTLAWIWSKVKIFSSCKKDTHKSLHFNGGPFNWTLCLLIFDGKNKGRDHVDARLKPIAHIAYIAQLASSVCWSYHSII